MWAMLLAGLGVMGAPARRRTRKTGWLQACLIPEQPPGY
jgi:hypothetical protein